MYPKKNTITKQPPGLPNKSLHIAVKKQEANRIDVANQKMMDRLLEAKGTLNPNVFHKKYEQHKNYKIRRNVQ